MQPKLSLMTIAFLLLLPSVHAAAPADSWPWLNGDIGGTREAGHALGTGVVPVWRTGLLPGHVAAPNSMVVSPTTVIIGTWCLMECLNDDLSRAEMLQAFDRYSGQLLWSKKLLFYDGEDAIHPGIGTLYLHGDLVISLGQDDLVATRITDGSTAWRVLGHHEETPEEVSGALGQVGGNWWGNGMLILGNTAYVMNDYYLSRFNADTGAYLGRTAWEELLGEYSNSPGGFTSDGSNLYLTTLDDGRLVAIDVAGGAPSTTWTADIGSGNALPQVADGMVVTTHDNEALFGFGADGTRVWTQSSTAEGSNADQERRTIRNGIITLEESIDGYGLTQRRISDGSIVTSPNHDLDFLGQMIRGGDVLVVQRDHGYGAADTMSILGISLAAAPVAAWAFTPTPGPDAVHFESMAVASGWVYFATDTHVYGLRTTTGTCLADQAYVDRDLTHTVTAGDLRISVSKSWVDATDADVGTSIPVVLYPRAFERDDVDGWSQGDASYLTDGKQAVSTTRIPPFGSGSALPTDNHLNEMPGHFLSVDVNGDSATGPEDYYYLAPGVGQELVAALTLRGPDAAGTFVGPGSQVARDWASMAKGTVGELRGSDIDSDGFFEPSAGTCDPGPVAWGTVQTFDGHGASGAENEEDDSSGESKEEQMPEIDVRYDDGNAQVELLTDTEVLWGSLDLRGCTEASLQLADGSRHKWADRPSQAARQNDILQCAPGDEVQLLYEGKMVASHHFPADTQGAPGAGIAVVIVLALTALAKRRGGE